MIGRFLWKNSKPRVGSGHFSEAQREYGSPKRESLETHGRKDSHHIMIPAYRAGLNTVAREALGARLSERL